MSTPGHAPGMCAPGRRVCTRDARKFLGMGCVCLGGMCSLVYAPWHPDACSWVVHAWEECMCRGCAHAHKNGMRSFGKCVLCGDKVCAPRCTLLDALLVMCA